MKKIIAILLLCIYSFSTLGLSLKSFYCCGKLKSVTVSVAQDQQQKYANNGMDDCCKTKYQFYKVKDNHVAADVVNTPVLHFFNLHLFTSPFEVIHYPSEEVYIAYQSNAPPLFHTVPDYIFNCVFRI